MAMLAQFLGEEAVAHMSHEEIERTCEILHAEMLKSALTTKELRGGLAAKAEKFATAVVTGSRPSGLKEFQDALSHRS